MQLRFPDDYEFILVSEGTLRIDELIINITQTLIEFGDSEVIDEVIMYLNEFPNEALEISSMPDKYWLTTDAYWEFEKLLQFVEDVTPEGWYYSSSEGDGALFGFWKENGDEEIIH